MKSNPVNIIYKLKELFDLSYPEKNGYYWYI